MSAPITHQHANPAYATSATPRLSVLIPFYKDDPTSLLQALAQTTPGGVEVILIDDGVPSPPLNADIIKAVDRLDLPVLVISSRVNRGRSGARNRLAKAARSPWLLFLDADMAVEADFLTRWVTHTQTTSAGALFGGFMPVAPTAETQVHAALEAGSNVHSAAERNAIGAVAVCSSNLAVNAEAFAQTPFDESFSGWGWEDVDWALSAAAQFELGHVDNPARHGGLEGVERLLSKFGQSGPNFARLLERHPDYADRPGARLASKVKALHLAPLARALGALVAHLPLLPVRLRVLGVKLFRAGVCAEALS
jgi:hypothetical protein